MFAQPINQATTIWAHLLGVLYNHGLFTTGSVLRIEQGMYGPGKPLTQPTVYGYIVLISTHGLARSALALFPAAVQISAPELNGFAHIWVPASILQSALPGLVKTFLETNNESELQPRAQNMPSVCCISYRSGTS